MEVKEIKKEKNTKTKELPLKVETEMIYSLLVCVYEFKILNKNEIDL